MRMYEGMPLSPEDHSRLISFKAAMGDFDAAEKDCRTMLAARPDDRQTRRLLADVLSWKKDYSGARVILEELARTASKDPTPAIRLAEVHLWDNNYTEALARFTALLQDNPNQSQLWRGFADAAASAEALTPAQQKLAVRVAILLLKDDKSDPSTRPFEDVVLLTRLAWVLYKSEQTPLAATLAEKAAAQDLPDVAARRELAGVLASVGKNRLALGLYRGMTLEATDRLRVAYLCIAEKEFDAAEEIARGLLVDKPGDRSARLLLADVLSWNRKHQEAIALFEELLRERPQDTTVEARLAHAVLSSGDHGVALAKFFNLLRRDRNQPDLWAGYVDAAASASSVPASHRDLVHYLFVRTAANRGADPVFLSRLAWVLRQLKEDDKAIALLQRCVELDPNSRPYRLQLAETLQAQRRFREAEPHFHLLLSGSPTTGSVGSR